MLLLLGFFGFFWQLVHHFLGFIMSSAAWSDGVGFCGVFLLLSLLLNFLPLLNGHQLVLHLRDIRRRARLLYLYNLFPFLNHAILLLLLQLLDLPAKAGPRFSLGAEFTLLFDARGLQSWLAHRCLRLLRLNKVVPVLPPATPSWRKGLVLLFTRVIAIAIDARRSLMLALDSFVGQPC